MPTSKRPASGQEPAVSEGAAGPASAPASATTPGPDTAAQKDATTNETASRGSGTTEKSGGRWLGRLLRVTVLVALFVGVGAGIYYGWPIVYDRVIAPVQTNTSDLGALRDRIAQVEAQVSELGATDASIQSDIAGLESRLSEHDQRLAALDAMDATLATNDEAAAESALRQVRLLKGMELMSRARLFLYQSNFGLAEQDLAAARAILGDLRGGDVDGQAVISVAVDRLDRAIDALPLFPVAASDELDIAWQALLGEVPVPVATAQPGPSASATPGPSAPVEPAPSPTP